MRRTALFVSSTLLCLALAATPALAAKGGNGGGGGGGTGHSGTTGDPSIAMDQSNPYLGETVTFATVYPDTVKYPRVQIMCYQIDTMVYGAADTASASFVLGGASSAWLTNGGGASCEADLYYWSTVKNQQTFNLLASMTFDATGAP